MPDVISGQAPAADPVSMISALLDAERVTPDTKVEATPDPAQPETDVGQPNAQAEGEDAETAATTEIPLHQLEAIELETTYKGHDGKDVTEKLTVKELRKGYMQEKDYSRKMAEVARQREEVNSSIRQGVESERTQYLDSLQTLEAGILDAIGPELRNANWKDLSENQPAEYLRLFHRQQEIKQALDSVKAKQQEVKAKIEADRRQAAQATAPKTWATLEADIPGWNAELYQSVVKAAESVGYTQGEVGAWLDHRAIKLLHKAKLYDDLKAAKPAPKVAAAPKAIAPGAPAVPKATQQLASAKDRLRKSGKLDDLTAVLASIG